MQVSVKDKRSASAQDIAHLQRPAEPKQTGQSRDTISGLEGLTADQLAAFNNYLEHRGDQREENRMIVAFMPVIRAAASVAYRSIAQHEQHMSSSLDELTNSASWGFVKALRRYDPGKGRFMAYVYSSALGEARRAVRDFDEIRRRGFDGPRIYPGLDGLTVSSDGNRKERPFEEIADEARIKGTPNPFDSMADREKLREALSLLDDREKKILSLRFIEDKTQTEIARIIGLSQMSISRLIRKSLAKLRRTLEGSTSSEQ